MKILTSNLNLAGEYAVASELCRRDLYAQLTLGNRKRTDILILNQKSNKFLRIEVKAKQAQKWGNQRGIFGKGVVMVFVDFSGKKDNERPDFYLLTVQEWKDYLLHKYDEEIVKGEVEITDENVPRFLKNISKKTGKPQEGVSIKPEDIENHKEKWEKIVSVVS
jgi:hypothetical protein